MRPVVTEAFNTAFYHSMQHRATVGKGGGTQDGQGQQHTADSLDKQTERTV
jgi:hypothetical protein